MLSKQKVSEWHEYLMEDRITVEDFVLMMNALYQAGVEEHPAEQEIGKVVDTVAEYFQIGNSEMLSGSRNFEVVLPRRIAMFLLKDRTNLSCSQIAAIFGNRDHSTVLHAVEDIRHRIGRDEVLKQDIARITELLDA